MTKKIIALVISIILVAGFGFCLVWTITNFDKVQKGIGGTGLYTQEDLDNAYEDGYKEALKNEVEYLALIEQYRDQITNLNDTITQLNSSIKDLQTQVSNLTTSNTNKDGTISALNSQITSLQASITNMTAQITALNGQISTLTSTNIGLSTDLYNLNSQLAQLQGQALGYTTTINRLNSLVVYFSNIVIDWENRTEFLATFYVNGQIWDIQVIDHINTAVTAPALPAGNFTFVGWSLDGNTIIDPTQIPIVTDTNFQAVINVTATFTLDGVTHNVQTIRQNTVPATPAQPSGAFNFEGWSLDGNNVVNISAISQNTTYIAVYNYTVSFVVDGSIVKTEQVKYGSIATAPTTPLSVECTFAGWSINGTTAVDVSSTVISSNTTFTALLSAKEWTTVYQQPHSTGFYVHYKTEFVDADLATLTTMALSQYTNVRITIAWSSSQSLPTATVTFTRNSFGEFIPSVPYITHNNVNYDVQIVNGVFSYTNAKSIAGGTAKIIQIEYLI